MLLFFFFALMGNGGVCTSDRNYCPDTDPPAEPEISGPYSVTRNTSFELTCFADANPPAHYWWTQDLSNNARNISTGITLTFEAPIRTAAGDILKQVCLFFFRANKY